MSDFLTKIDARPPHWAGEVILSWDAEKLYKYRDFVRHSYWTDRGSINVFCVKGTDHPDYQGLSWQAFLHKGKRMDINIPMMERNPDYYLGTEAKKPGMYYNSYNGLDWYVGSDGNHRTGLARFLFYERQLTHLHGVTLNHYVFDDELLATYCAIQTEVRRQPEAGYHWELTSGTQHVSREDTAGWKTDHFMPFFTLKLAFVNVGFPPEWQGASNIMHAAQGKEVLRLLEGLRAKSRPLAEKTTRSLLHRLFNRGAE
ncbi:hypothetical protein J1782_08300 [Rahnella sp. BCC 1045]|uniref:hypothetical protein n=1 Tax=Rahnella sp. BCC 1045 TaxID=2816251 RepID=UPI001C252C43|nr:hypothetical protein [Rahnella sp. BCC 1045]MBU9819886.1 hypothetical protein [Rahnella sp. BCC 1045]